MKNVFCILTILLLLPACGSGQFECSEDEGSKREDLEKTVVEGLFNAAESSDLDRVKELISKGANLDVKNERGETLLHVAAVQGNYELTNLLIASGADVNVADKWKDTPLHELEVRGFMAYLHVRRLRDIARLLLDKGADINARNSYGKTPLHVIVSGAGDKELTQLYISKGADVSALTNHGHSPLDYAVDSRNEEIAALLQDHGARFGNPVRVKLFNAAGNGDIGLVKKLLAEGAAINASDTNGNIPLHLAAKSGHMEVVKLLIAEGADVNRTNVFNEPPLFYATDTEVAKTLIAGGANVTRKNEIGYTTVLHNAVRHNNKKLAELLISEGACVDWKNLVGQTPIHLAAMGGYLEIAQVLIAAGADVNTCDHWYKTPLDKAKTEEMKQLLRGYGAVSGEELKETTDKHG